MLNLKNIVVGVDASRNRSGGAIAHIRGIMSAGNPSAHGIATVHLWGHASLLALVPDFPWLIKHLAPTDNKSIISQLLWQRISLPKLARVHGVQVMFNTDAGSVCPFFPAMTLSQDMLSFEPREIERYRWYSKSRIRLEILRFVQLSSLNKSSAAIFLSRHAEYIIGSLIKVSKSFVIPHGIDERFFIQRPVDFSVWDSSKPIRALYVSNAAPYKHQWNVVEAFYSLRKISNIDLKLRLVGGGSGDAMRRLIDSIERFDPGRNFVELIEFLPNDKIISELINADFFVYASSCENLPITLLEAMASGLPIASSDRGPMPEVLGEGGVYFDPEVPSDIARAIKTLVDDSVFRKKLTEISVDRAKSFSWKKCADATWSVLSKISEVKVK